MVIVLLSLLLQLHWFYTRADEHCPALNINFKDLGISFCSPTLFANTLADAEKQFEKDAKCMGWKEWDLDPALGCKSPVATEGVVFEYPCYCDFGGECKIRCKYGYRMIGSNIITCQVNGLWSQLPTCSQMKCRKPNLPPFVELLGNCGFTNGEECNVKCSDLDYRLDGDNIIRCQEGLWQPSTFPECHQFCKIEKIPKHLEPGVGCSTGVSESCEVSCRNKNLTLNGPNSLNCTDIGEWTRPPTCGCSPLLIPPGVVLKNNCKYAAGKYCLASCAESHYLKSDTEIQLCNEHGQWDSSIKSIKCLPKCGEPVIPPTVVLVGKCHPYTGEMCEVKCKDQTEGKMRMNSYPFFYCEPNGEYSRMPTCSEHGKCPKTVPGHVKIVGKCLYFSGSTCYVRCTNRKARLYGLNEIRCQSSGTWSRAPRCTQYCPKFKLPENAIFLKHEDKKARANDSLIIKCNPDCWPEEPISYYCNATTGLYIKPRNFNGVCAKLCLPYNVSSDQFLPNCPKPSRRVDVAPCKVNCKYKGYGYGPNATTTIQCLPGLVWTPVSPCVKLCKTRDFNPTFRVKNCNEYIAQNEKCELECVNKNETLGTFGEVTCRPFGLLISNNTKCVKPCLEPKLPDSLHFLLPCKTRGPGETCELKCKDPRAIMRGSYLIFCTSNGTYTTFPTCEFSCRPPVLKKDTHIVGTCHHKSGSQCKVACKDPNQRINDKTEAIMKCVNTDWTIVGNCEKLCDMPVLHDSVMLRNPCSFRPLQQCHVLCKDPEASMFGSSVIMCMSDNKWNTNNPKCAKRCGHPHLPDFMDLVDKEDCKREIGKSCKVQCSNGYVIGSSNSEILCLESLSWSSIPNCVRACPEFKWPIEFQKPCSRFGANTACKVKCLSPFSLQEHEMENVVCKVDGQWDKEPICVTKLCVLPPYLVPESSCTFEPQTFCRVKCRNPDEIMKESNNLMCSNSHKFISLPTCVPKNPGCSIPDLTNEPFDSESSCEPPFSVYYKCYVRCSVMGNTLVGANFILCEPGGIWSRGPRCVGSCHLSKLPYELAPLEKHCTALENTYCSVICREPSSVLIDYTAAYCAVGDQWQNLPKCAVGAPGTGCLGIEDYPPYLKVVEVIPGHNLIVVACRDENFILKGSATVGCKPDDELTPFPTCERPVAPYMQCEITSWVSCDKQNFGESCSYTDLTCTEPTVKTSYCLSNGQWSNPPCDMETPSDYAGH